MGTSKNILHKLALPILGAGLLSACVSFAAKAPPALLVLTPDSSVTEGTVKSGTRKDALVILPPETPRKLNTTRIPVQVNASSIAYLKDAVWADKPTRLFQGLLAEIIAAKNDRFVLSNADAAGKAEYRLAGALLEFGIDAATGEAVIVYDAVKEQQGKAIEKRRFEIRELVGEVEAAPAGEALNEAANKLAIQVADWIG